MNNGTINHRSSRHVMRLSKPGLAIDLFEFNAIARIVVQSVV